MDECTINSRTLDLKKRGDISRMRVPLPVFNDAAIDLFRKEFRTKRRILSGLGSLSDADLGNQSKFLSMSSIESIPSGFLDEGNSLSSQQQHNSILLEREKKGYEKVLEKAKVYELTHKGSSYGTKWHHMKDQRDHRHLREAKRDNRVEALNILKKTVIAADKMDFHHALEHQLSQKKLEISIRYNRSKRLEDASVQRRRQRAREEAVRKETSATALKDALLFSTELARLSNAEHEEMKRALKPDNANHRLSEYSSSVVSIPESITTRIKTAKRLSQYKQATADAKRLYEETLRERIARYARSKEEKLARAANIGSRITLAPIRGDEIFHQPPDMLPSPLAFSSPGLLLSPLASKSNSIAPDIVLSGQKPVIGANGLSRTASGTAGVEGTSSLPPSGGGSPFFSSENAFLKELAMREYWRRQSEYESDGHSEASGGSKADDSSWKTDPRLKGSWQGGRGNIVLDKFYQKQSRNPITDKLLY